MRVQCEIRQACETADNFSLAGMEKTARSDEGADTIQVLGLRGLQFNMLPLLQFQIE